MKNSHSIILLLVLLLFFAYLTKVSCNFIENKSKTFERIRQYKNSPKFFSCKICGFGGNEALFKNNKCPRCGNNYDNR